MNIAIGCIFLIFIRLRYSKRGSFHASPKPNFEITSVYIQFYDAFDFPREGFDPRDIFNSEEKIAALDFYIGESAYLGKGLGAEWLRIFLQHLVFEQFDACLVDPEKSNQIAVKTYAKAGFALFKDDSSIAIMIARKI